MGNIFGKVDHLEYDYDEDGSVESIAVESESVEVPEQVAPDTKETNPDVEARRGKFVGGSDYVFRGDL